MRIFSLLIFLFLIQSSEYKIPDVAIKTLDGKTINTSSFSNNGKPYLICFFATWCKPCKNELDALSELLPEWQKETGMKIIAVSIDDPKTAGKISPFVKSNSWDFEFYHDENMDFKRALNVICSPHLFLINADNNIVWQHDSYKEGDEDEIYLKIKESIKK